MDIRIVMAPLRGAPADHHLLDVAHMVAKRFGAHVTALHIELSDAWVIASLGDGISEWNIHDAFNRRAQETKHARAIFDDWIAANRLEEGAPADGGAASFQVAEGFEVRAFPVRARYADLVVLSNPTDVGVHHLDVTLEVASLLQGGCPTLIVPHHTITSLGRMVAIAWDASAEAARAVRYAMPFLERAAQVHVMTVREHGSDEREIPKAGRLPGCPRGRSLQHGPAPEAWSRFRAPGSRRPDRVRPHGPGRVPPFPPALSHPRRNH
jgi:hypothetical protein